MPSENEMFYGIIQQGLDKWNAAFFCGSAAVLRRSALEQAGGFAGSSITEDCETALELHSAGWNSIYINKPLIAGLQPETFASFIGQRTRWCTGMLQILIMKRPAFKKGLTLAQRACYLSICMSWLFPIPRMIFLFAPLLYIFFDLKVYNATIGEFGAYTLSYLMAALLMQSYAYGRVRWPWVSELYEYVQSIYLLPAIIGVIRNPRRPTFNVTAKGGSTNEDALSSLAWPYFVIFGLLLSGAVIVLYRMQHEADAAGILAIAGLWNLLNICVAGLALGVVSERRERRKVHRVPTRALGALEIDGVDITVQIVDVSQGGLLIQAPSTSSLRKQMQGRLTVTPDARMKDNLPLPIVIASIRAHGEHLMVGLSLTEPGAAEYSTISGLMFGDLELLRKVRQARQRNRGLIPGTVQVLAWSVAHTLRGIGFALFRRKPASAHSSVTSE
jgi:cellulose synthase (UDP-forming)